MDIHNNQFGSDIEYDSLDLGTPAWVVKPGPAAIPAIPFVPGTPIATENFEGTLWSEVPFAFGDWEVTSAESHGGTKSFRGKTGIGKTTTTFAIYDFFGSSQVSFWYKNPGFVTGFVNDKFEVLFDGTPVFTQLDIVNDWTYVSIPLNFAFEIDFVFTKNFPIVDDTDTVFLDDLVLGGFDTPGVPGSPAHPLVYAPMHLCEDDRLLVSPAVAEIPITPEQIIASENFEGAITGSGTWAVTASSPHTGTKCLKSAVITDGQTTDYTFSIPATSTAIRFWERVSSEANFDFLSVYKDSVSPGNLLFQNSGTANTWAQHTLDITGATQVIFRYNKDSSGSSGLDAAFIDDIQWIIPSIPAHTVCAPLHTTATGELKVVLLGGTVAVTGIAHLNCNTDSVSICQGGPLSVTVLNPTPTVSGTGKVDTRPLTCATDSVTVCQPNVGATVTNVAGTNLASTVLLAANVNRKSAILYNDSSNACFVKFGATASSTSFTVKLTSQTFYELSIGYTGVIEGIWQNSANGAMRVTEFT